MSAVAGNVIPIEVYGDRLDAWSVLIESGDALDTLAPVDITDWTHRAEIRSNSTGEVAAEWVITIGDQGTAAGKGWVIGELDAAAATALRAAYVAVGGTAFSWDLRSVDAAGVPRFPIVRSSLELTEAVTRV